MAIGLRLLIAVIGFSAQIALLFVLTKASGKLNSGYMAGLVIAAAAFGFSGQRFVSSEGALVLISFGLSANLAALILFYRKLCAKDSDANSRPT